MTWIEDTQKALRFIEDNLENDISVEDVANYICSSPSHFQRSFGIVTGFSLVEYIRLRRLSLAGQELRERKYKVIDIALRFGYDTPESFTKAFARFHGVTPSEVKNGKAPIKVFVPLTIEMNIKGGYVMARKLIPNVEKLYENKAENYMFPSCMRSAMYALGEDKAMDFLFFAGVCGDLFTQTWCFPKWQYNDSYSNVCHQTVEPIKAAFNACGYEFEYVPASEIQKSKSKYVQKIVESIDKGIPVLTFGIVGPPICSIIFGYDESGDVLIGWSQFTDEHVEGDHPTEAYFSENYFQKRNGLDKSDALIFIGNKKQPSDITGCIRASILSIPKYANLSATERTVFGKAAFEEWADTLLDDTCFQSEMDLVYPLDTYGSCVVQIGTNMHYMQKYLLRASEVCPDILPLIDELKNAYQRVQGSLKNVTDFQGGYFFDADKNALLRKDFRDRLSELIRDLGSCYMDAVQVVEDYCNK